MAFSGIEPLVDHLDRFVGLSEKEKAFIREQLPVKTYTKGQVLLEEGEVSTEFFYNLEGCVRLYYDVKGEDRSAFFYTEGQFISSYASFTRQEPSRHSLQAIEESQLAVISQESAALMLQFSPRFEALARMMMEEEMIVYQEMIASFITLSPAERYQAFLKNHPGLMQRMPQRYIASYLGVNPESLSRIKKRIIERERKS